MNRLAMTPSLLGVLISSSGPLAAHAADPPSSQPASRPAETAFDLRINPLVELHFMLRKQASSRDQSGEVVQALRDVEKGLGGGLGWALLESPLAGCASAAEARQLAAELPESFRTRDGREVRVREHVTRLAEVLVKEEPNFLADSWPERRKRLEAARERITAEFLPKQRSCFDDVLKHLGMTDPGHSVPVYLVTEAPYPGAVTHRNRGGGGLSFVSLDCAEGTQLYETILHESIHALDVATLDQDTVLQVLRKRLGEAGLTPSDRMFRDVPHTLMFVQAAETIRRVLDPAHEHYGDKYGYYPKVPQATQAVRPNWEACLRGEVAREQAIDRIIEPVRRDSRVPHPSGVGD